MNSNDWNPEIKPCPFCGVELVEVEVFSTHSKRALVHPSDPECVLRFLSVDVPRYAPLTSAEEPAFERLKLWNTRQ